MTFFTPTETRCLTAASWDILEEGLDPICMPCLALPFILELGLHLVAILLFHPRDLPSAQPIFCLYPKMIWRLALFQISVGVDGSRRAAVDDGLLARLENTHNFQHEFSVACFSRTDRPDCVDGRLSFIFYSHLKNMKEIYVTSPVDRKGQAVKGQVSNNWHWHFVSFIIIIIITFIVLCTSLTIPGRITHQDSSLTLHSCL